jgi:aldose 1-epimerase
MKKLLIIACAMIAGAVVAEDKPQPAREQNMRKQKHRMMRDVRGPLPVRDFGKLSDGRRTKIYTLKGAGGLRVDVSDYGGRIVRVYAPDRHGNLADVTLGWNTAGEYEKYGFSMGTLIGRFGNRIADGKFKIDGKEYQLPINEKTETRNCNLHSGPEGWDSKIWKVRPRPRMTRGGQALELTYVSPDGDMGFPGTVTCKVVYAVSPANVLSIEYTATTDKPTIINLTHHGYWNMAGEASGNVLNQELQIFADEYSQVTAGLIPTKNIPVKGTPFDFTSPCVIGSRQQAMLADEATKPMDSWYDHNFVLRGKVGEMKKAAIMKDPVSGRKMEIWTTEPCMQMYGAQNMTADKGLPAKQAGAKYLQYQGFALETQHAPDSPNHPEFPSTVLRPGETFSSRTEYRFTAE